MNPLQSRQEIISLLAEYFESKSYILAYWLGGSDANSESDEYSDLDIFLCAKDGEEKNVLTEAQQLLKTLGNLDYIGTIIHHENNNAQTFHIEGTSEHLLIEIFVIPQSQGMQFTEGHPAFKPKVIFDKAGIITFVSLDQQALERKITTQLAEQKNLMMESSRAMKYIQRGEYIEATNYYIKYVYLPLISVLRIKHTPLLHDWLRIHISRHFPKDIVLKLEELMRFSSLEDLEKHVSTARKWFWEIVEELESSRKENTSSRS